MKRIGVISDTHGCFDEKLRIFLKDVDEIYCLNDGKIVESGNYESLLRKKGYFAKLYKVAK